MLSSLERSAFISLSSSTTRHDTFFDETLPQHLKSEYFSLYLLALQQRFALLKLSERIAVEAGEISMSTDAWSERLLGQRQTLSRLRASVLDFHVRSLFRHVSQRDHHQDYFARWCRVLDIDPLLEEVRTEYAELSAFVDTKAIELEAVRTRDAALHEKEDERHRNVFGIFVSMLAVPGVVLTYLQVVMQSGSPEAAHLAPIAAGCAMVVGFFVGWGYPNLRRRTSRLGREGADKGSTS